MDGEYFFDFIVVFNVLYNGIIFRSVVNVNFIFILLVKVINWIIYLGNIFKVDFFVGIG